MSSGSHRIGKLLALVSLVALGSSASAVMFVQDTFNISGESNNVSTSLVGRQTGTLAPLNYTEYGPDPFSQVGNSGGQGYSPLLLGAGFGTTGAVSPNFNFTTSAGLGNYHYIKLEVDPVSSGSDGGADAGSWVSVNFGKDAQTSFVNSAGGFGLLFRGNGQFQAFSGTSSVGAGVYSALTTGLVPIEIRITDAADGNAFDNSGTALIQAYASNSSSPFFSTSVANFANNYIRLEGSSDNSLLTVHYVENLEIGTIPEPSSAVLLMVAGGVFLSRRRR